MSSLSLQFFQNGIAAFIPMSPVAPAYYRPCPYARAARHAAVFFRGKPVLLLGEADCPLGRERAEHVARLEPAARLFCSPLCHGIVSGDLIDWENEGASAIVEKGVGHNLLERGFYHHNHAIVLGAQSLMKAAAFCVTTELVRVLHPNAPELDDGDLLNSVVNMLNAGNAAVC